MTQRERHLGHSNATGGRRERQFIQLLTVWICTGSS